MVTLCKTFSCLLMLISQLRCVLLSPFNIKIDSHGRSTSQKTEAKLLLRKARLLEAESSGEPIIQASS